jgi:hypothetical protein
MKKSKVTYLDEPKRAAKRPKTVTEKTVVTRAGERKKVVSVNANSESFPDDFLYAFTRNVRAARRENRAMLGSPSGARKAG